MKCNLCSQLADVPVGWQQPKRASWGAWIPPETELLGPLLQPFRPRAPNPGAVTLHGEVVHGRKQPGNAHPAEFPIASCQTHRSKVEKRSHIIIVLKHLAWF